MKEEILKLQNGKRYIIPESDYGKAEIWLINDIYFVFDIPMYGGFPQYHSLFHKDDIDEMIAMIDNWT
jgi:hypothetical protein